MGNFVVEAEQEGVRLDLGLVEWVGTRSKAQRMIKLGLVLVDGEAEESPKKLLQAGETVEFELPPSLPENAKPVAFPLEILYEDEDLLLVNKPRGMVTHPSPGHHEDSLVNFLLYHTRLARESGLRPGIVHRIDKDTSGLLVVAKTDLAQEGLAEQFRTHSIERRYVALVWGELAQPAGTIDQCLGRHPRERMKFAVRADGKRAVTHYRRLKLFRKLSLVECRLETGRTHQIRVHLSHLGHPLVGDPLYGQYRDLSRIYPPSVVEGLRSFEGQALHAQSLGFTHPVSGEQMFFEVEMPEEMSALVRQLEEVSGEG